MLDTMPKPPRSHPLSSVWRRIYQGGYCLLPCAWHYSSKVFLSEKGLQKERERQLNYGHCFSIHPYSPFKFYWDVYIMAVYFVSLIYLPLQVFRNCPDQNDFFVLYCDAMNFLHILFNFKTGIVEEDGKNVNLTPRHIAMRYLKDTLVLDILSALPLQLIPLERHGLSRPHYCKFPTHTVFYVIKFPRIIICSRVWRNIAHQLDVTYFWSTAIITILRSLIIFHWMTYVHIQVPVYLAHFYPHTGRFQSWLIRNKVEGPNHEIMWSVDKYITNLYLVTGLCIGAGFYTLAGKKAQYWEEQLLTAILSLIGLACISYLMTTLLRLILCRNYGMYRYYGLLTEIKDYLKYKRVSKRLHQKIKLFINYRFNGRYYNQDSILNTLNIQIKQEINMYYCKNLLINVPLFQDMPIALINTIIFSLTQVLYMPGETVVRYGRPGSSLYLIASGTVAVMDESGKEVGHLMDGAFFGETTLVSPGLPRSATIIALEITEIYKLNHNQFRAALQPFPRLKRRLLNPSEGEPRAGPPSPSPSRRNEEF